MRWALTPALLLLLSAPAQAVDIYVVMIDDVPRGSLAFNRASGLDLFSGADSLIVTPNLDTMAADGITFDHFVTYGLCSPTRAAFMLGTFTHRRNNNYGTVKRPDADPAHIELDPYGDNIFRRMKAAGYSPGAYGKWHVGHSWVADPAKSVTMLQAMGLDHAVAVGTGNPGSLIPSLVATEACLSHNYSVLIDLDGNVTTETENSTKLAFDAAKARAASSPFANNFLFIGTSFSHAPWRDGTEPPIACAGAGTQPRDDRPPGSIAVGDDQVYRDQIAYVDLQIGLLRATMAPGDMLIFMSDNGLPPGITVPTEAGVSGGIKNSPYPFGTWAPLIFVGGAIGAGETMGGLYHVVDLTTTLLALVGDPAALGDGRSFANCLTSSGGESPGTCWDNDWVPYAEWAPFGGITGVMDRMPGKHNANSDYSTFEMGGITMRFGGVAHLLHRIFWTGGLTSGTLCELFWEIHPTTERYTVLATGPTAETSCPFGGRLTPGDVGTDDQKAAVALLEHGLDGIETMVGVNPPTLGGISM